MSYNRNVGIDNAVGQIIGFPDDDCVYENDTLEKVINFFNKNKDYKIYSCKTMDSNKVDAFKKCMMELVISQVPTFWIL